MNYSTIEGCIRQTTKQPIKKMKPTNFSIKESLEVVWEAIHEWNEQASDKEYSEDDVKTGMAWIMEELGYGYDKDGEIEREERPLGEKNTNNLMCTLHLTHTLLCVLMYHLKYL